MTITPRAKEFRIVIADDEALPAELLRRLVTRLGHRVVGMASDGAEAVALTHREKPDAVLLDLRMPRMDGFAAASAITREVPTPIVVVSALDDFKSLEQAVQAGVCAYLVKPPREDELERALEIAVARFADLQEIQKWKQDAEERAQAVVAQNRELERLVSDLRRAQVELVSAARRATVASLAQGLAHEINNALTPIIGHAQLLSSAADQKGNALVGAEVYERAEQIVAHAKRIAALTASLRQFTFTHQDETIPFSFNGIIQDALELYRERFRRMGIEVQAHFDNELAVLEGHPDQIQEVILSLLQNAIDAMPLGGSLLVTTSRAGEHVAVEIADTGRGIQAEHLALIYEPGFTTKVVEGRQSGFGWGLFTAREIVDAHGGRIKVESRAAENGAKSNHGTTVRITLPASAWASAGAESGEPIVESGED